MIYFLLFATILWPRSRILPYKCDGAVLEIYLDDKYQWPQGGLKCESLAYEVVT